MTLYKYIYKIVNNIIRMAQLCDTETRYIDKYVHTYNAAVYKIIICIDKQQW